MQVTLSITKAVFFQGKLDEFSNVYEFTGVTDSADAFKALSEAVVGAERGIHSSDVQFKRVRIWGDEGLGVTTMQYSADLLGVGSIAASSTFYRECALMVRWPLEHRIVPTSFPSPGFKRASRYLRKYLHLAAPHSYSTAGDGNGTDGNAVPLLKDYADRVVAPVAGVKLCAPNGDLPTAGPTWSRYLEHRQFPRGRKE